MGLASFGVTAFLVFKYHLGVYAFGQSYSDYSYYAYSKPYTRIPCYFVGIVAAWMLDEMERKGITRESVSKNSANRTKALLAAILSAGICLFCTFIPTTNFGTKADDW